MLNKCIDCALELGSNYCYEYFKMLNLAQTFEHPHIVDLLQVGMICDLKKSKYKWKSKQEFIRDIY
jgi:hypothetical protein